MRIIAFFESAPAYAQRYLSEFRAPFAVIADDGRVVCDRYGLETSWPGVLLARLTRRSGYREAATGRIGTHSLFELLFRSDGRVNRMPTEFLLTPDLHVGVAHYGRDSGDFLLFAEIEKFLQGLALPSNLNPPPRRTGGPAREGRSS
jgi:hypothetical protein